MDAEGAVRRLVDAQNAMGSDGSGIDEIVALYHRDLVWRECPTSLAPSGRAGDLAGARAALKFDATLFTDRVITVHDLVAVGDHAAVRYTWSGTVAVDLGAGMARVGARVHVESATFLRLVDGLIAEVSEIRAEPVVSDSRR